MSSGNTKATGSSQLYVVPDISVLITIFNTATYLAQAIESVLTQETERIWELILVDDGSTDDSLYIAKQFAALYPRQIRVLQHAHAANRGISESRNLALKHARGSYVAFLDSDDVWLPHHLETLGGVLERVPQAAAVYAAAERWVDFHAPFHEGKARTARWGMNYLPPLVPAGEATGLQPLGTLLRWMLQDESKVPCICSMLVRTAAARAVGGFVDEFRGLYDDQAFHAKLSVRFAIYAEDVCVARYRQHAASCCAINHENDVVSQREQTRFRDFVQQCCRSLEENTNTPVVCCDLPE